MKNELTIKIKVIIGSTRQNRFSEKPAHWIFDKIKNKEDVEAELLDLRDYPMPFLNDAISPYMAQGKYKNEIVKKWAEKIKDGDAFIAVSPEYNHGYPAVLKNAFDSVYIEWNNKPIGFVSYGGVGGARAVEQLRQVSVELGMAPIRNSVHIMAPWNLIEQDNSLKSGAFDSYTSSLNNLLEQLIWWAKVLKSAR